MSLQFSTGSTSRAGIVELIDKRLGTNASTYPIADKVADINSAIDDVTAIALKASGNWQYDDNNQTDEPVIYLDIVNGQRQYSFIKDGTGNVILDFYKVMAKWPDNIYHELDPVDQQSDGPTSLIDERNVAGIPVCYDKTGNSIFLDLIPNYDMPKGIKIFINRESQYFTVTDTTKMPGFVGLFHRYLVIKAAYTYAASKGLPQAGGRLRNGAFTGLLYEVTTMEAQIDAYYGGRAKDERPQLQGRQVAFY